MTGTVVAGFGILAHLEGRDERAKELFELLVATRSTGVDRGAVRDDRRRRGLARPGVRYAPPANASLEVVQRLEVMARSDFFASLGVRLREELGTPTAD